MNTLHLRALVLTAVLLASLAFALPAAAQEGSGHGASPTTTTTEGGGEAAPESGSSVDIFPVTIWMLAGVAASGLVLGVLYLFKRQIGGFPEHPTWVAPISIMRPGHLPADDDPHGGHGEADAHGGGHAPAH